MTVFVSFFIARISFPRNEFTHLELVQFPKCLFRCHVHTAFLQFQSHDRAQLVL